MSNISLKAVVPVIVIFLGLFSLIGLISDANNVQNNYSIQLDQHQGKLKHQVSLIEHFYGFDMNSNNPTISITGYLTVKDRQAREKCKVSLPSYSLKAENAYGKTIPLLIQGYLGEHETSLSTEPVKPIFDELGRVQFTIEGYVDPSFDHRRMAAGKYEFLQNFNLNVQFE